MSKASIKGHYYALKSYEVQAAIDLYPIDLSYVVRLRSP